MTKRKEEKAIARLLSRYYCLTKEQICEYVGSKTERDVEDLLRWMASDQILTEKDNGRAYAIDPRCEMDPDMVYAFWVFLKFAPKVKAAQHYMADEPSHIAFLKDQNLYEIAVIRPGQEYVIQQILAERNQRREIEEADRSNLILAVFKKEQAAAVKRCLKGTPAMIALLEDKGPYVNPNIRFARV